MIPDHVIDKVRTQADILDVVGDFVTLKKKGSNWWALSPFTNEKTPSFAVSPAKNIFKCFSSGKAGDSINFIMEVESLSFIEAIRFLAKKYGIDLEEQEISDEDKQKRDLRESLFIVLNFAKDYYHDLLLNDKKGRAVGLSYFKERGFTAETINTFELGYSADDWHAFENHAAKKQYSEDILQRAGLIIRKEDKKYDRFRGRVMFPVHDLSGRTVAFGARTLKKDDKPKYLNSPETEVYVKNKILYGIYQAKNEIRKEEECFMVEGYTDVLAMHQAGVKNVVASSGTSLTEGQIRMIKRFTDNMTVLYDGDSAGIKASLRGIDLILEQGMNVKAVVLPQGEDPDSYVRKLGGEDFKAFLKKEASDFITFKTNLYLSEAKDDPLQKARAVREIVQSIAKIPDEITKMFFYKKCSELLDIEEQILISEGNKILLEERRREAKRLEREEARRERAQSADTGMPSGFPGNIPLPNEEIPAPDSPGDIPLGDYDQSGVGTATPDLAQKPAPTDKVTANEIALALLLVRHGHKEIEGGLRVYDYVLSEIEDMGFHHPDLKELLDLYYEHTPKGHIVDFEFLSLHASPALSKLLAQFVADPYELSEGWEQRYEINILKEDETADKMIYRQILKLKLRHLQKLERENLRRAKELPPEVQEEEMPKIMKVQLELKAEIQEVAKILGAALG